MKVCLHKYIDVTQLYKYDLLRFNTSISNILVVVGCYAVSK